MHFPSILFRTLTLSILLISGLSLTAQDTLFLDPDWKVTSSRANAEYYRFVRKGKADTNMAFVKTYYMNGKIESDVEYGDYQKKTRHGHYMEWFEDGQLLMETNYRNGEFDGTLKTYWPDGTLKRHDEYANGKLLNGKAYDRTGKEAVYCMYREMPQFPGGTSAMMDFIIKTVRYPKKARRKGIQGKVFVKFVVNGDGSLSDFTIIKGVSPELDAEALRAVKAMPRWSPGKEEGEPVNVYFNLPINFILRD